MNTYDCHNFTVLSKDDIAKQIKAIIKADAKIANSSEVLLTDTESGECQICYSNIPSLKLIGLKCGHFFCENCWRDYLTIKIKEENIGFTLPCAAYNCDILVNVETVKKFLLDENVKVKYTEIILRKYVQSNKLLKFCPNLLCNYVIEVKEFGCITVTCHGGHTFCFACTEMVHYPMECRLFKKWLNKCFDTNAWIKENTKECPQCHCKIEKNGGCDHIVCQGSHCKYEFCWRCLQKWEKHSNCIEQQNKDSEAVEDELRFKQYYKHYSNHMKSLKVDENLLRYIRSFSVNENVDEFIETAFAVLRQCREGLMITYAFAYYLLDDPFTELFEFHQNTLEDNMDKLCHYLCGLKWDTVNDLKERIIDCYKTCTLYRNVLVDAFHEGFVKNYWKYNVPLMDNE